MSYDSGLSWLITATGSFSSIPGGRCGEAIEILLDNTIVTDTIRSSKLFEQSISQHCTILIDLKPQEETIRFYYRFVVDSYFGDGPVMSALIPIEDEEDSQSSIFLKDESSSPWVRVVQVS